MLTSFGCSEGDATRGAGATEFSKVVTGGLALSVSTLGTGCCGVSVLTVATGGFALAVASALGPGPDSISEKDIGLAAPPRLGSSVALLAAVGSAGRGGDMCVRSEEPLACE